MSTIQCSLAFLFQSCTSPTHFLHGPLGRPKTAVCAHLNRAAGSKCISPQISAASCVTLSGGFPGTLCLQTTLCPHRKRSQPLIWSYSGAAPPRELLSHVCCSCRASLLCCHLGLESLSRKLNESPSQWAGHCPSVRAACSIVVWVDPPEKPVRREGEQLSRLHNRAMS